MSWAISEGNKAKLNINSVSHFDRSDSGADAGSQYSQYDWSQNLYKELDFHQEWHFISTLGDYLYYLACQQA